MRVAQAFFSSAGSCRHPAWLCVAPPSCGRSLTFCPQVDGLFARAGTFAELGSAEVGVYGGYWSFGWWYGYEWYFSCSGWCSLWWKVYGFLFFIFLIVLLGSSTAARQFVAKLVDLPVVLLNRCAVVFSGLMLLTYMTTQLFQVCFLTPKCSES